MFVCNLVPSQFKYCNKRVYITRSDKTVADDFVIELLWIKKVRLYYSIKSKDFELIVIGGKFSTTSIFMIIIYECDKEVVTLDVADVLDITGGQS